MRYYTVNIRSCVQLCQHSGLLVHSPTCNIPDVIPRLYSTGFHHSEMLPFKPEHVNEIFHTAKLTLGVA